MLRVEFAWRSWSLRAVAPWPPMPCDAKRENSKFVWTACIRGSTSRPISDISVSPEGSGRQRKSGKRDHGGAGVRGDQGIIFDDPAAPRSLVSSQSQALLYRPHPQSSSRSLFEIGSYKAGTTEAICRALYANGKGTAHAVDPFRGEYIAAVLKFWPPELIRHVRLHAKDSMAFFGDMERHNIHPALVFVDGNHDYEFAAFDIACGARAITPGGYIVVDNVAQPGAVLCGARLPRSQSGLVRAWHRDNRLQPGQGL